MEFASLAAQPTTELGRVEGISGSKVTISLSPEAVAGPHRTVLTVGKFLKVESAAKTLVGILTDVNSERRSNGQAGAIALLSLLGEITTDDGRAKFVRGVHSYPTIGDAVGPLGTAELQTIFESAKPNALSVGHIHQDPSVTVKIEVGDLLSKHFAVVGSTGAGKSTAVVHLLHEALKGAEDLRVLLLDPHNEYETSFGAMAHVVTPGNFRLPFWIFNFEEIVDVFYGGRPSIADEVDILAELIPLARATYLQHRAGTAAGLKKIDPKATGFTVDTPVPYRIADLIGLIDERMGKLENRSSRMLYQKLISRLETVSNDPRYVFMFDNANVGGDTMADALSELFRFPANGKRITVVQLARLPSEVVDAVVSVLGRLAFDFGQWSNGSHPLLFLCEEAHKFAAADRDVGFAPTRRALARIAKEGRKYGVHLGVVTQRPAELDPTIISLCGTIFAMRMTNEKDQALLRSAITDTGGNLIAFASSLGPREALAFGTAISIPSRITFPVVPADRLPRGNSGSGSSDGEADLNFVSSVLDRWRSMTTSRTSRQEVTAAAAPLVPSAGPAVRPVGADNAGVGLLKRPLREFA
jgi:DNA helicase HerA-like ATPase